jgi:excisionase family DNA binding protein
MSRSRSVHPIVVKVTTAAELLQCSRADIYNRIARGELRRVVLGDSKSVRIPIEDVYALVGMEVPTDGAA